MEQLRFSNELKEKLIFLIVYRNQSPKSIAKQFLKLFTGFAMAAFMKLEAYGYQCNHKSATNSYGKYPPAYGFILGGYCPSCC